jgi:hypothetical protein
MLLFSLAFIANPIHGAMPQTNFELVIIVF